MRFFFIDKPFFFAFAAIPALLAIYLLFRLAKPLVVSSLMLWERHFTNAPRGWALKKVPLPPTFWLEALILIFLVVAAASPRIPRKSGAVATLILDNSYSMRAAADGSNSARRAGEDKLCEIRGNHSRRRFRIILAGSKPTNLGMAKKESDFIAALKLWKCDSASADISAAVALAKKLAGGAECRVFVITDHSPKHPERVTRRMDWFALGRSRENVGVVKLSRIAAARGERLIAILANLGGEKASVRVRLQLPDAVKHPDQIKNVDIPAGETAKIAFTLPADAGKAIVSIQGDDLEFDNHASALSENQPPLRVAIDISNRELREIVEKALKLQGVAIVAPSSSELIIGERRFVKFADVPQVVFPKIEKGSSTAVAGPYSLDKSHMLTNGLNLKNTIWCLSPSIHLRGDPLVFAGDKALLSLDTHQGEAPVVMMNFEPRGSTLQHTPNWPILICNIVDWAKGRRSGLARRNFKCGENVSFLPPKDVESIILKNPDGEEMEFDAGLSEVLLPSEHPGEYVITAGKHRFEYITQPVNFDESDLSKCGYGHLHANVEADLLDEEFVDLSWIAILAAIALLFLHGWMIRRKHHSSVTRRCSKRLI